MTKNIAKIIDQTNIDAKTTAREIKKTCEGARKYNFRGVCVNPEWVKLTSRELTGTNVKTICLVDPPIGDSPHEKRIKICQRAKKDGADETDVVVSVPDVKHERWGKVLRDLKTICRILPTKVIIGSGYLIDEEIKKVSSLVKRAGAICVKTATDKDPLEHRELKEKANHLKLMKRGAPGLLIKASGKVKTLKDLKLMVKAGANIIGTSSGEEIMKEFFKKGRR
jgi:deoxyribose-phosphate aldolase